MKEKSESCFFFKKAPPSEKTKDLLIDEARKQFSEKGFEGASVRDICAAVNANVSAIKYYFGGKEGLYRECFIYHGRESLQKAERLLIKCNTIEELKLRIKLYSEEFLKDGIENSHMTKMICREIENANPLIQDIFENTFLKSYTLFSEFFIDAQSKGLINKTLNPHIVTSLFFHSLTTPLRVDHVASKYFKLTLKDPKYREEYINHIISIMFDGIKLQEQ